MKFILLAFRSDYWDVNWVYHFENGKIGYREEPGHTVVPASLSSTASAMAAVAKASAPAS